MSVLSRYQVEVSGASMSSVYVGLVPRTSVFKESGIMRVSG